MRMLGNGNVAIGDTTANAKLHVHGDVMTKNAIHCFGVYGGFSLYSGFRDGEALAIERLNSSGSWVGMGVTLLNNGNVGIGYTIPQAKLHVGGNTILGGNTTIGTRLNIGNSSCQLRILTSRADTFSWVTGRLAEYSDFSIEYNDGSQYGLYGSINYYSGDFAWQVGRSDGLDILRNLYLQPLGGNVAIGGTTASAKLHVYGDAIFTGAIEVKSGNKLLLLNDANSSWESTTVMEHTWASDESDGLKISIPSYSANNVFLHLTRSKGAIFNSGVTINGKLLATGAITMFSQLSMKNVIDYDGLSLAQLAQILPARFTWKDGRDNRTHVGGIADEVMKILPEVIHRTSDDKLTMDYGSAAFYIVTSLIKPVVDHEQRLQSAEKEIKDLKAENKRLREQLRASQYAEQNRITH
jgi:hypothetical protein